MSKKRIFALSLFALLIGLLLTNPSQEEFDEIIKTKAKDILKQQLKYENEDAVQLGMSLFGNNIIQNFVDNNVVIENYYFFSIAKINWQGQKTPIGGGAFKKIWLSPKIDEKAEEIIKILKNI